MKKDLKLITKNNVPIISTIFKITSIVIWIFGIITSVIMFFILTPENNVYQGITKGGCYGPVASTGMNRLDSCLLALFISITAGLIICCIGLIIGAIKNLDDKDKEINEDEKEDHGWLED